jgi:hypothetical protein
MVIIAMTTGRLRSFGRASVWGGAVRLRPVYFMARTKTFAM